MSSKYSTFAVKKKERSFAIICSRIQKKNYAEYKAIQLSLKEEHSADLDNLYEKVNNIKNHKLPRTIKHENPSLTWFRAQLSNLQELISSKRKALCMQTYDKESTIVNINYKASKICPPVLRAQLPAPVLGQPPSTFINVSPPNAPLFDAQIPVLTDVQVIDRLIDSCVKHAYECSKSGNSLKVTFKNGAVFGQGMQQEILCKQCNLCGVFVYMHTSCNFKISLSEKEDLKNLQITKLVFSCMDIGMGFNDGNRLFSSIGLPFMNKATFSNITEMWGNKLWEFWEIHRKAAHDEENAIARLAGDVDSENCPLLAVTADGGWFTRCNRGHTYKSKTGCQVIRGLATKKVLWVSVKNAYCAFCYYHHCHQPDNPIPDHICYKNYKGPPQGMEQEGIVDGFLAGYKDFLSKYSVVVADGDSSTFPNLVAKCSWTMKKCHCCNHFHKCCRSRLEKAILTQEFKNNKWHLEFPSAMIVKLCKSLKAACRTARVSENKKEAEINLRHDVTNAAWHVLGFHEDCRVAFCSAARQLKPDVPVPEKVSFRRSQEEVGKLGSSVKTFLQAKWEGSGESLDACLCDNEGNCICNFDFKDDSDDEDFSDIFADSNLP